MDIARRVLFVLVLLGCSGAARAQNILPASIGPVSLTDGNCATEGITATGCVTLTVSGYAGVSVQVTGTWAGTLTFRGSTDQATFQSLNCAPTNSTSAVTSTTGNGLWKCGTAGLAMVEAIFTVYTSGTAQVTLQASQAADGSATGGGGGGGGGPSGTIGAAVPATASPSAVQDNSGNLAYPKLDASGNLLVDVAAGGGAGGTSSSFGAAFPATGTASGFTDGTNMQGARVFDVDTGAGTQNVLGVDLRLSAGGGSVEAGTSSNPLRIDPTGATTQPVSGTVTVQQGTAANLKVDLSGTSANATAIKVDGSAVTQPVNGTVTVQQGTAANLKVDLSGTAANATAIKVDGSGVTQPVSGTVTVQQSTAANLKVDLSGTAANGTAIKVDGSAVTQPISGTVTANQGGAPWSQNLTQVGGTSVSALSGAAAGSEAGAPVRPVVTQRTATGTLSVVCSDANINACTANSTVALTVDGYNGAAAVFANTNLIGTIGIDWSMDGSNWTKGLFVINGTTGTAPTPSGGKDFQTVVVAATGQIQMSPVIPVGTKQVRLRVQALTSGSATGTVYANTTTDVFGLALTAQVAGKNALSAYTQWIGASDGTTSCTILGVSTACLQGLQARTTLPAGNELALLTSDRHSNDWACSLSALGTTKTQCLAAPAAGIRAYVTSFQTQSTTGTASTVQLQYGTGSNCATGSTNMTGVFPTAISSATPTNFGPLSNGLQPVAANAICATGGSGTNTTNIWVQGYYGP